MALSAEVDEPKSQIPSAWTLECPEPQACKQREISICSSMRGIHMNLFVLQFAFDTMPSRNADSHHAS